MITVLLLVLCGLLIGISLGAVGAGGSILAVPVLVYVAGEPPKQATVSALVVVLITSLIALRPHWTAHRVRTDLALPFAVTGTVGALIGKRFADGLNADVLMLAFAGLMIVSAALMTRRLRANAVLGTHSVQHGDQGTPALAALTSPTLTAKALVVGVGVGAMTGFFGVGGGFVIVPALVLLLGVSMTEAVGTSLAIIVVNTIVTTLLKAPGTSLDLSVIGTFAVASAGGALLGGTVSQRYDAATLTRWFVVGVVVVALYTAARSLVSLAG